MEQQLQLGFITKQKLWTDNQLSIDNETTGSKEYIHVWLARDFSSKHMHTSPQPDLFQNVFGFFLLESSAILFQ